jgi:hypothetical protein
LAVSCADASGPEAANWLVFFLFYSELLFP